MFAIHRRDQIGGQLSQKIQFFFFLTSGLALNGHTTECEARLTSFLLSETGQHLIEYMVIFFVG